MFLIMVANGKKYTVNKVSGFAVPSQDVNVIPAKDGKTANLFYSVGKVYLENVHDVPRSGSTPVDHMSAYRNQMKKTV
jgi:hypothetical protein